MATTDGAIVTEQTSHRLRYQKHFFKNKCSDCNNLQEELVAINSRLQKLDECTEPSANIIGEQLGEQQVVINSLKHQFQILKDKINEHIKIRADENMYEKLLLAKENEITNLKHRINEEIEEKNYLKSHYNDETSKLNNEINELEQKIKNNQENSQQIIEQKVQDIQILQEQKLSLLQSLNNEITKFSNIITKLKTDIEIEQQSKQNIRDWYENKLMKLNVKVLNRNNELVELQDGIFEKGETIENLQIELRKEKELSKKYHSDFLRLQDEKKDIENTFQKKMEDMALNYEQKISALSNKTLNPDEHDSENQCDTESRKRMPLQDASNFNNTRAPHLKTQEYYIMF